MKNSRIFKGFTAMVAVVCMMMLMSATVFAATKDLFKDGAFVGTGFINAGQLVDGTIQGPGNWTQLNLGDAAIDVPYLHIVVSATGDTAKAQVVVSDKYTVNLSDLGVSLTEELQDVVLPVGDQGLEMLSWCNFTGLDGGSSVYTIKEIFLSDDAASTLAPAVPAEETAAPAEETPAEETPAEDAPVEEAVPDTGYSMTLTMVAIVGIVGSALVLAGQKKYKRA
ncbi:MAG: LPXTG-motif cell wall anchor domain protein [Herbinix sp.]|jgi:hypothetical protein|nr:LPXTG-motif cell wall anchor domain protein [Herbinix sp.]